MTEFFHRLLAVAERAVVALEIIARAQQSLAHSQAVLVAQRRRAAGDDADGLEGRGA
jgi:hypothetical protein